MADIESMNLESEDLVADRIEQLKQLFPEIVTEGSGSVDFEKLRLIMGDEVNDDDERYAFSWPGKRDAIRQSQTPSSATLRPAVDESRSRDGVDGSFDSDNLYIEGDNLEVLKLLQHSYHGKVKMIYIDPPYNTGHDFVYKDSFADTIKNYKQQAGLSGQSNADTSGRYHSDWCSMIYPRLKLARELLAEDGVLFVSIDDNEENRLQTICNEIFGESNYIAKLQIKINPRGRNLDKFIARTCEPVLCYGKDSENLGTINPIDKSEKMLSEYNRKDEKGVYRPIGLRNRNQSFNPITRPTMYFPLYVNPETGRIALSSDSDYSIEVFPDAPDGTKTCWTWSAKKIETENMLLFAEETSSGWRVFRKDYADKDGSGAKTLSKSLWDEGEMNNDQGKAAIKSLFGVNVMDFPKSPYFINKLIRLGSNMDSLVMDFFSGSATLAEACISQNGEDGGARKFIMIQLPEITEESSCARKEGLETICEIGKERIRRAGAKISTEIEVSNNQLKLGENPKPIPDIGFRVFKLDESGINKQDLNATAESGKLFGGDSLLDSVVKPNRSDMDIIFEMMLKWGLELTLPVEKAEARGYQCYVVAGGELICCMEAGLTVEALEAIAEMEPRRVLMLDSILTDTLKLNAVQIFKRVGERTGVDVELRTV